MQSVWKRAMAASRLKEEAAEAAAAGGGGGDDDDELQFVSSSAGFKKREAPAKGKPGRKRAADAEAFTIDDSDDELAALVSVSSTRGGAAKRGRQNGEDADFERLMKELNDPQAAAAKGKSGAGKRGGKAGAAAAVDAAAGEAGDAAGGGSAAPSSSLLASTTQRLASLVERSKAAHKLAAAAQAGELPDDVAAAGGSAAAAAAAADDGSEPARPSPSSKPGKAAPAPAAAAAAAAHAAAARGSAAAAAAPASAAGAPADAAEKRVVVLTVSMKGSKPEEYPQLTLKLSQKLAKAIDYMQKHYHPKGQLKYNGRTLQHTDTPASALDGEDVWAEAQESNEEPLVMVDFVVPATG